jgi:hypothetical protein
MTTFVATGEGPQRPQTAFAPSGGGSGEVHRMVKFGAALGVAATWRVPERAASRRAAGCSRDKDQFLSRTASTGRDRCVVPG